MAGKYFVDAATKLDFERAARARKEDFEALRAAARWTASVYLAPYIVELRLKYLVCEYLQVTNLPAPCKTHDLVMLLIYCGKYETDYKTRSPTLVTKYTSLNKIHTEEAWRYKPPDPGHKQASDDIHDHLFNATDGIVTWLGI